MKNKYFFIALVSCQIWGCSGGSGSNTAYSTPPSNTDNSLVLYDPNSSCSYNSGVVTLTGSAFGAKSTAAPIRFETFPGTSGSRISSNGWWSTKNGDVQYSPVINTSVSRVLGRNVADFSMDNNGTFNLFRNNVGFKVSRKAYVNFWVYLDLSSFDGVAAQVKLLNLLRNTNPVTSDNEYPDQALSLWSDMNSVTSGTLARYYYGSGSAPLLSYKNSSGDNQNLFQIPGWYNFIIQVDQGTLGSANGKTTLWLSGPGYSKFSTTTDSSLVMQINGGDYLDSIKLWHYLQFRSNFTDAYTFLNAYSAGYPIGARVNYNSKGYRCIAATGPKGAFYQTPDVDVVHWTKISDSPLTISDTVYMDSVYIDNSFARVEMCDKSNWSERTHCEMQLPISWTTTEINSTFNKGSFNSGETVYFYVVNESGSITLINGSFTIP